MSRLVRGPVTPRMNITPLIDVVFLLIIFFMLISNILSEEIVAMLPPDPEHSQVRPLGEVDRIVINIAPQPFSPQERSRPTALAWSGEANTRDGQTVKMGSLQWFSFDQLEILEAQLADQIARGSRDAEGHSQLEVLLRADAALYYHQVEPVMAAITRSGIRTIHLVAHLPTP